MLIAEIRHKLFGVQDLDPEDDDIADQVRRLLRETQEDLLTADVFGAMKYLPRKPYLEWVLRAISERNQHAEEFRSFLPEILSRVDTMKFRFWPSYPTPRGIPGARTEPDVELYSPNALLLFEAKLHSRFGDDQVLRELAVALVQSDGRQPFLVLVTPGFHAPFFRCEGERLSPSQYVASASRTAASRSLANRLQANQNRVLWISWRGIVGAFEAAREEHRKRSAADAAEFRMADDILSDLLELMRMRGIFPFKGIGLGSVPPPRQLSPIHLPGLSPEQRPVRVLSLAILARPPQVGLLPSQKAILFDGLVTASEKDDSFRGIPDLCQRIPDAGLRAPLRLAAGGSARRPRQNISTLAARWPYGGWRFRATRGETDGN